MRQNPHESKRVQLRQEQPVRHDTTIQEWPEYGLVMANGPDDPIPSVRVESGRVIELDGRTEEQFDPIDLFIARHAIDTQVADQAMAIPPLDLARMLFDPNIEAKEIRRLFGGLTPARLVQVVWHLDVLEMMLALRKMRLRHRTANQAHVTNRRDHPALLAADAAEAARRGFAEVETTVGVAPLAPLNSIAVLIGSQVGRPGVLTQAAVEEGVNLRLALKGLVSYAETLSVYGTARSFQDGDDTPWSKAFLASAYASRGVKVRFTSGSGSELLMGHAGGHSMLYLEARCLLVVKGAGSQGVQNGAISCIALPLSLPAGIRGVMAENLMAASLGLEVASGNDALASHSDTRKSAKLMLQFLPGTDFVTSGYSVMPREDNLFGGGNFEAKDLDVWTLLQRDFQIDAGITPVPEDEIISIRERAARAVQAVYHGLGLPSISDEEVHSAVEALNSDDLPSRSQAADIAGAKEFFTSTATVLDVARILQREGFHPEAQALMALTRQRAAGDYLQPASILTPTNGDLLTESAFNTPHLYSGPGTGYRVEGARWEQLKEVPFALRPQDLVQPTGNKPVLSAVGTPKPKTAAEVVVGLSPAFGHPVSETLSGLSHKNVLEAIAKGIEQEGVITRLIHILDTADCAFIGHEAAQLSGSGIAIGLQSRGTAVIHRKDLAPLDNLELLSQAPNLTLESYRALGRNAARYALGFETEPVPVKIDNTSRLRHIVQTTLLHRIEVEATVPGAKPVEVELVEDRVAVNGQDSKLRKQP
jgi:propanediol dehydratase large subunit